MNETASLTIDGSELHSVEVERVHEEILSRALQEDLAHVLAPIGVFAALALVAAHRRRGGARLAAWVQDARATWMRARRTQP